MTTPHELIAKWRADATEENVDEERYASLALKQCADELADALAQPQPAPDYEKEGMIAAVNRGAPTHAFYSVPQVDEAQEAWLKGFNFVKAELDFQFQRGLLADRNPLDLGFKPKVSTLQPAPDALREALRFYADEKNWGGPNRWDKEKGDYADSVEKDRGAKARAALGEGNSTQGE